MTSGNLLGARGNFDYTADDGTVYRLVQDESVGSAVGNTAATAINAKVGDDLTPRYILLKDSSGNTKKVVIGDAANALFTDGGDVTIDGVEFDVTFASGEKRAYPTI